MPAVHRVEESPTNRAGCRNTECKNAGIKIDKGELRLGTLVEIQENQSWHWKHWGCVTPLVLERWKEVNEMNSDLIDGYDEISEENQEKVMRALEQGHVDDEDWKGDIEKNRPGQKGFRTPNSKVKANDADVVNKAEEPSPTKRNSTTQEESLSNAGGDKPNTQEENLNNLDGNTSEEEVPKKKRGRPKEQPENSVEEDNKPAKKRGRPRKNEETEVVTEKPAKRARTAKKQADPAPAAAVNSAPKPAKRGRGRPKKKKN